MSGRAFTRAAFRAASCKAALAWCLLGAAAIVHAEPRVLPASSEIAFVSKQMGVPVEGRFKRFDAQIDFDPRKPEAGKVAFSIDTGSANIGAPEVDAELPKANWFDAAKFPKASFQSSSIKATGPGRFDVAGLLTIKGHAQAVVVPLTLTQSASGTIASGTFLLKRLVFKIGDNEWADTSMVANDVQVKFRLAIAGLPPF